MQCAFRGDGKKKKCGKSELTMSLAEHFFLPFTLTQLPATFQSDSEPPCKSYNSPTVESPDRPLNPFSVALLVKYTPDLGKWKHAIPFATLITMKRNFRECKCKNPANKE
jgi:hypothetical protein